MPRMSRGGKAESFAVGQTLGQTASFRQTAPETWCQSRVCGVWEGEGGGQVDRVDRPGGLSYYKKSPTPMRHGAMKVYYNLSRRMTDHDDAIIYS